MEKKQIDMEFILKNNRAIIFATVYSAMLFAVNFFSGQLLSLVFLIPGLSGLITGFTVPLILIIGHYTIRRYGTITLIWTIYSTAAIPFLLMGPPGPYKILIGLTTGAVFEIFVYILSKHKFGDYFAFVIFTFTMFIEFALVFTFFIVKPDKTFLLVVVGITVVFIIEGLIAIYYGKKISDRLIKQPYFKNL